MKKRRHINKPACYQYDCFANECGHCEALNAYPKQPCPFYKTEVEAEQGRLEAHKRLQDIGREDLIHYYEYNKERKW